MDTVHCSRCFHRLPSHALYCSRCGLSVPIQKPVAKVATQPSRRGPSIWLLIFVFWLAGKLFTTWHVDSNTMKVEPMRYRPPKLHMPEDVVESTSRALQSTQDQVNRIQESIRRNRDDIQRFNRQSHDGDIEAPRMGRALMTPPKSARRVIFVCDATEAMTSRFGMARQELRRSIDALTLDQAFNVIFYHQNTYRAAHDNFLLLPTAANKAECFDFMDAASLGGRGNPIAALQFALRQAPDVIFFVTSGDFSGCSDEAVARFCRAGNPSGHIRINPVVLRPREQAAVAFVLERIARESGGDVLYASSP